MKEKCGGKIFLVIAFLIVIAILLFSLFLIWNSRQERHNRRDEEVGESETQMRRRELEMRMKEVARE